MRLSTASQACATTVRPTSTARPSSDGRLWPVRFPGTAGLVLTLASVVVSGRGASAQAPDPGRKTFEQRCARCHGADGNGGEMGPAIAIRLSTLDDRDLTKLIHDGRLLRGMPPNVLPPPE